MDWHTFLSVIGEVSITYIWIPIGLWTLAALPLFVFTRCLGKAAPHIHYLGCLALLIALPVGFLAMPWTTTVLQPFVQPVQQFVSFPTNNSTAGFTSTNTRASATGNSATAGTTINPSGAASTAPVQAAEHGPVFAGTFTLFALLASVFGLLNMGFQWVRLNPLMTRFAHINHPDAVAQLERTAQQLRISRSLRFKSAPEHIAPFTYGVVRPSIVVPANILEEKDALHTALYHELIHVKRNDYGAGLVAHFLAACFIFHPMVWLLSRHIATYRELSCDKALLQQTNTSPADYARLLLRFNQHNRLRYVVSMRHSTSNLKQRVQYMADYPDSPLVYERKWVKIALVCLGTALPVGLMSCSEQPVTTGLTLSHPSTGALEELGLTMEVANGWRLVDTTRFVAGISWERRLNEWPENIRDVYLRQVPKPKIADELTFGINYYQFTDILTADDIYDISYGRKTEFYKYELFIELRGKRKPTALALWKEGKCMYSDLPVPQPCTRNFDSYRLIKRLTEAELPFGADSGYLYESEFHYSYDSHGEQLTTPRLSYHFYIVRENRAYLIRFFAYATDPDKAHLITKKSVLKEPAIAEMLASIQFE